MTQPDTDSTPTPEADDTAPEPDATTTDEPEPRSLLWWKDRARAGEWLVAESRHEADLLKARVESMQRRQVETMVGAKLHNPTDIWHYTDLAELLTDGDVDPAKVNAVELPSYVKVSPAAPASMVTAADPIDHDSEGAQTFQQLLQAAARGSRGVGTE